MKLIADVNISPITVKILKEKGYDIIRVTEVLSPSASDNEIIRLAIKEDAVIVTQDLDFSAIIAKSGLRKPSVISIRTSDARPDFIAKLLLTLIPLIKNELHEGAIISVNEREYRVRKIPVIEK